MDQIDAAAAASGGSQRRRIRRYRRADRPVRGWFPGGLLTLLALVLLTLYGVTVFAQSIEDAVRTRVRAALDREGLAWASVEVSGQNVLLRGAPPNPLEAQRAWPLEADACDRDFAALLSRSQIQFETGRATIPAESHPLLEKVAELARGCPGRLSIEGHTDVIGSEEANLQLSQDRAAAVREQLVHRGLPADRLLTRGFGEGRPLAGNDTEEGRARNRRIEFHVVRVSAGGCWRIGCSAGGSSKSPMRTNGSSVLRPAKGLRSRSGWRSSSARSPTGRRTWVWLRRGSTSWGTRWEH